ncbi:hypothetical protein [Microbacterium sp. cf332]|uniref:hypothetical protein n=1 Tax=Microbacterium sp. cf332 TaxID=1761804 RepID=UPI000891077E|nr:hypothetical protein [Microbacterium sp. cf332]SDQ95612.1 hypothetical protein SAMN04487847_3035 [Microbacterium sp. cf332]
MSRTDDPTRTDDPFGDTAAPGSGVSRRALVRGAAWAAPVIAVSVAAPLASASVQTAGLAWTASETGLLGLRVLDGTGVVEAGALVTVPTVFTITNGAGAIDETATITIVVGRPAGLTLPVGRARGFGVATLDGTDVSAQNSVTYSTVLGSRVGFPVTTLVTTRAVAIPSNGTLSIPVEFGLSGSNSGISVGALATFPVTLTVVFASGATYQAQTTISVPVGAGIL